jgi:hypothetical protein
MLRTTGSASRRIDPPRVRDAAVRPRSRSSAAKTVREYTIDHDRAASARCAWQRRGFGPGEGHNNTATSEITSRSAPAIMVCRSPRHRARRRPRADRSAGHGSRARSSREGSCHPARCPSGRTPRALRSCGQATRCWGSGPAARPGHSLGCGRRSQMHRDVALGSSGPTSAARRRLSRNWLIPRIETIEVDAAEVHQLGFSGPLEQVPAQDPSPQGSREQEVAGVVEPARGRR